MIKDMKENNGDMSDLDLLKTYRELIKLSSSDDSDIDKFRYSLTFSTVKERQGVIKTLEKYWTYMKSLLKRQVHSNGTETKLTT